MADNVDITAGTGTTIGTDDVGAVHFQRVKLVDGTLGATTAIGAGGGVESGALRVTLASDSTGVVSIDDNGGAITVDGTVAVTNAGITTIAGAVAGTEMQVDVLTMPTVTVNSHAVTNAGTFAVQAAQATAANLNCTEASAAAIKTAVEALDNSVDGNYLNVNMNIAGADVSGTVPVPTRAADFELAGVTTHVKKYYTNAGAVTDGIVWSPAAGKRWYITDIIINTSAAAVVTLEDDLSGGDSPVMKFELAANGGMVSNFNTPLFSGEDAADLIVTTSAGNIYITVTGYEI